MRDETKAIGDCAVARLKRLFADIETDTAEATGPGDIPTAVTHYDYVCKLYDSLKAELNAIDRHIESLSYKILPIMFSNQGVKTITLPEVGRVSVNLRWTASMINREAAMDWLRLTGNGGLIIETVNSSTLKGFAREEAIAGKPLPPDLFKVGTAQYISVTKAGVIDDDRIEK